MTIQYHKNFLKKYKKLSLKLQTKIQKQISFFINSPYSPQLRNHPLKGKYKIYRSINITGDWRAIFKEQNNNIIFVEIGTHSELFG